MYNSPLNRYASEEMSELFSDKHKFQTWRQLWVLLAREEKALGLPITDEQIQEMYDHVDDIDIPSAQEFEKTTHHDVMAHILEYGKCCPKSAGIIHMGATSCYVTDNADVMRVQDAMRIVDRQLQTVIRKLSEYADQYKGLPCVAYTHFQVAQPTTVGKRFTLWLQDFLMDSDRLYVEMRALRTLGCKGATGTGASFLQLFNGDKDKVWELERRICTDIGIPAIPISGQTYTRKQDFNVLQVLSGIAQSASKFATDIRLLSHTGEMREGFADGQVGSSAMPYKRNPIACECVTSLCRRVICDTQNAALTTSTQWLERSLDDSANRRLVIADTFVTIDAVLRMCQEVLDRLVIDQTAIRHQLDSQMDKISTEGILMYCTAVKGRSRQEVHDVICRECIGGDLKRVQSALGLSDEEMKEATNPARWVGLAEDQVSDFLKWYVN